MCLVLQIAADHIGHIDDALPPLCVVAPVFRGWLIISISAANTPIHRSRSNGISVLEIETRLKH